MGVLKPTVPYDDTVGAACKFKVHRKYLTSPTPAIQISEGIVCELCDPDVLLVDRGADVKAAQHLRCGHRDGLRVARPGIFRPAGVTRLAASHVVERVARHRHLPQIERSPRRPRCTGRRGRGRHRRQVSGRARSAPRRYDDRSAHQSLQPQKYMTTCKNYQKIPKINKVRS